MKRDGTDKRQLQKPAKPLGGNGSKTGTAGTEESMQKVWERENNHDNVVVTSQTGFWEIFESNHKVEGVQIPNTVVFKEGQLWRWYFSATKCTSKKIILRHNAKGTTVERIMSMFNHWKAHCEGLAARNTKYDMQYFLPFTPICYCRSIVEKYNTFLNSAETENVLTSIIRTIVYLQEFIPSTSHFEVFSAPRYYCMFNADSPEVYKCFKEVVEVNVSNEVC